MIKITPLYTSEFIFTDCTITKSWITCNYKIVGYESSKQNKWTLILMKQLNLSFCSNYITYCSILPEGTIMAKNILLENAPH